MTENRLFEVAPRRGRLDAGERVTLTLTYRHDMIGTDRLPVLLKLAGGREIMVCVTFHCIMCVPSGSSF